MPVSVLDFIPSGLHSGIQARSGTTDLASYIQNAIDHIDSLAGGELVFPEGNYICASTLTLCRKIRITGTGKRGSTVTFTQAGTSIANGSGFKSIGTINGSTAVDVAFEHIGILNSNALNVGGLIYDQAGSYWTIRNCLLQGGKYGVIFDQTEVGDIDLCEFGQQLTAGVWLVNGPDINVSSQAGFTNRISVNRCQHNQGAAVYGILDDGGYSHTFQDNNYNGCLNHIRAAGVTNLNIVGGEFESATGSCILLSSTRLSGGGVGQCLCVLIEGAVLVPVVGISPISVLTGSPITAIANLFGNTGNASVPAIDGLENCFQFFSRGNHVESSGPFFDQPAAGRSIVDEALREGLSTYDPPSIADKSQAATTVTVTDAVVGDFVEQISFSQDLGGLAVSGSVSAVNTVTVLFSNLSGAAVNRPSGTLRVKVRKRLV